MEQLRVKKRAVVEHYFLLREIRFVIILEFVSHLRVVIFREKFSENAVCIVILVWF